MARKDDIQYMVINDFSPGITADYRLNTGSGPMSPVLNASKAGQAVFSQTYAVPSDQGGGTITVYTRGCYANNEGKLIALPILRWDNPITLNALPAGTFIDVAGFDVVPAVKVSGNPQTDETWVWIHMLNSTPKDALLSYRDQVLVKTQAGALATAGPSRGITHFLSRGKRAGFGTPGGPELFWEWTSGEPHTDGSVMFYDVWPDPSATNTDTAFEETGTINNAAFLLGGQIVAHNGRVLRFCEQFHNFGLPANVTGVFTNERVRNTDPPNSVSLAATTTDSVIDPQNPNTFGAWGSLTYGELLIVKQYGGALLVEGDIYAPQITRLPAVQSTGTHVSETAWSAAGLIYMTDDGPYAWNGGATSERLGFPGGSSQVPFSQGAIKPITQNFSSNGGSGITCSVQAFNNLVIFSGGAVFDAIHHNWWSLEVPYATVPLSYFKASPTSQGFLYGVTAAAGSSGRIEIFVYHPTQSAGHLSQMEWLSQPIPVAYDSIDITSVEVSLGAMPADPTDVIIGIYFVTIDGFLRFCGNYSPNPTNNDGTWKFRATVGIRARNIQPYIIIFNNNGNIPAVNEIIVGYHEAGSFGHGNQIN